MKSKMFERIIQILFFLCSVVLIAICMWNQIQKDRDHTPEIELPFGEVLPVSCSDDESVFLAGVRATDPEDGDISDRVVVESISVFDENHERTVTYAVSDKSGHVSHAQQKIAYTDYELPKFSLKTQLCYISVSANTILSELSVQDCIDGDISSQIKIDTIRYEGDDLVVLTVSVINSAGDTQKMPLSISSVTTMNGLPRIQLSDYIVYLNCGDEFKPSDYITSIVQNNAESEIPKKDISISSDVDVNMPGSYLVTYSVYADNGMQGKSYMNVIVR